MEKRRSVISTKKGKDKDRPYGVPNKLDDSDFDFSEDKGKKTISEESMDTVMEDAMKDARAAAQNKVMKDEIKEELSEELKKEFYQEKKTENVVSNDLQKIIEETIANAVAESVAKSMSIYMKQGQAHKNESRLRDQAEKELQALLLDKEKQSKLLDNMLQNGEIERHNQKKRNEVQSNILNEDVEAPAYMKDFLEELSKNPDLEVTREMERPVKEPEKEEPEQEIILEEPEKVSVMKRLKDMIMQTLLKPATQNDDDGEHKQISRNSIVHNNNHIAPEEDTTDENVSAQTIETTNEDVPEEVLEQKTGPESKEGKNYRLKKIVPNNWRKEQKIKSDSGSGETAEEIMEESDVPDANLEIEILKEEKSAASEPTEPETLENEKSVLENQETVPYEALEETIMGSIGEQKNKKESDVRSKPSTREAIGSMEVLDSHVDERKSKRHKESQPEKRVMENSFNNSLEGFEESEKVLEKEKRLSSLPLRPLGGYHIPEVNKDNVKPLNLFGDDDDEEEVQNHEAENAKVMEEVQDESFGQPLNEMQQVSRSAKEVDGFKSFEHERLSLDDMETEEPMHYDQERMNYVNEEMQTDSYPVDMGYSDEQQYPDTYSSEFESEIPQEEFLDSPENMLNEQNSARIVEQEHNNEIRPAEKPEHRREPIPRRPNKNTEQKPEHRRVVVEKMENPNHQVGSLLNQEKKEEKEDKRPKEKKTRRERPVVQQKNTGRRTGFKPTVTDIAPAADEPTYTKRTSFKTSERKFEEARYAPETQKVGSGYEKIKEDREQPTSLFDQ